MDTKTKKYGVLVLLAVLVIGIVLTSGCMEEQKEQQGETQNKTTNETQGETPDGTKAPSETPNKTQTPNEQPATEKNKTTNETQGETPDGTKAPSETPNKTQTPNEQPATETLSEILGRGIGISSVKYDVIMTSQGMPSMTQKIWLNKKKMRTEAIMEGQTTKLIYLTDMDAKTMYMYMPAENMAMKMDFSNAPKPATESTEGVDKYKPVVVGTETIDRKVCIVYEYTAEEEKIKSWVWKDKGFPIRTEMTTAQGKIITEYKNIEFANIPDSMFELPAGVKITEMPTGVH